MFTVPERENNAAIEANSRPKQSHTKPVETESGHRLADAPNLS